MPNLAIAATVNVNLQDFNKLAANFGVGATGGDYDDYTTEELQDMLPD